MLFRDPEARPDAIQCLQHPFFQVGIRTPLTTRSPVTTSPSGLTSTGSGIKAQQQLPAVGGQPRAALRRGSRDIPGQVKAASRLPLATALQGRPMLGRRGSGASERDSGLLPALSLSGVGPRTARYQPGTHPADVLKPRDWDNAGAPVLDNLLPQKNSFGRSQPPAVPAADRPANPILEPRRGLGRRY